MISICTVLHKLGYTLEHHINVETLERTLLKLNACKPVSDVKHTKPKDY